MAGLVRLAAGWSIARGQVPCQKSPCLRSKTQEMAPDWPFQEAQIADLAGGFFNVNGPAMLPAWESCSLQVDSRTRGSAGAMAYLGHRWKGILLSAVGLSPQYHILQIPLRKLNLLGGFPLYIDRACLHGLPLCLLEGCAQPPHLCCCARRIQLLAHPKSQLLGSQLPATRLCLQGWPSAVPANVQKSSGHAKWPWKHQW